MIVIIVVVRVKGKGMKRYDDKGGDIMINYVASETHTSILGLINTVTYNVDGTACKAEIGTQKLN